MRHEAQHEAMNHQRLIIPPMEVRMSLRKKQTMTRKKISANQRNGRRSHGPATAEGRERIRAAHLRHGFYSQAEDTAMKALGEDPAQYRELVEELWEEFKPVSSMQEGLVIRLARAIWLMNRADRMQEGYAVRQAEEVNSRRPDRLHARMMRLKITAEGLRRLAQTVAHKHFVTTPARLETMKKLHQEGGLMEMGEIALALFCQLQAPGSDESGLDPQEWARRMVDQAKEIFGIGTTSHFAPPVKVAPDSGRPEESPSVQGGDSGAPGQEAGATKDAFEVKFPSITAAEWVAREDPRQLLENILRRLADICEEQRKAILKEIVQGPSPYECAAQIAPTHPNARLMRRMQDVNFREVRRVTNLLLKLKRHERRMDDLAA